MKNLSTRFKLNLQLCVATILVLAGLSLIYAGFIVPPIGEIHNSVLIAFGELLTFAGSLYGVDYRYKYKTYVEERRPRHYHPRLQEDQIIEEEDEDDQ